MLLRGITSECDAATEDREFSVSKAGADSSLGKLLSPYQQTDHYSPHSAHTSLKELIQLSTFMNMGVVFLITH